MGSANRNQRDARANAPTVEMKTVGVSRDKKSADRKRRKTQAAGWTAFTEAGSVSGWLTAARVVLIVAFASTIPTILGVEHGRRILWTVIIALLPIFWVLFGYHIWRRICPLAVVAQLGRYLGAPGGRRMGPWLSSNYIYLQLGLLFVALSLRLVAINGNEVALAGFFVVVVVSAIAIGFVYTGKTFCNYVCPVGLVEKMYTEPSRLAGKSNSQCAPCTACKKHCPDIDLEGGYWKEMDAEPRRLAYFVWPGVVLGFYAYFYFVAGSWDYYFSGAWAYESGQTEWLFEPGLTFARSIPVVAAAPLTLLVFGAASYALFATGERIAIAALRPKPSNDDEEAPPVPTELVEKVRHRALVVSGFIAVNIFYFYGGQPTLREGPGWGATAFSVIVVFVTAAMFFRRWNRSETDHVQEKFAQKILKRWEWGEEPPSDNLQDIYLLHSERTKQREARLRAYKETVRELVADGVVTRGELVILDSLRAQLGVSDKDHDKVLNQLSDEERQLFDPEYQGSVEQNLQRQQYERDLERAVIAAARDARPPTDHELEAIRVEHGVAADEHAATAQRMLSLDGPLADMFRTELAQLFRLGEASSVCEQQGETDEESASLSFARHLTIWRGRQHMNRATAILAAVGDTHAVAALRERLDSVDNKALPAAITGLRGAAGDSLVEPLIEAVELLAGTHPKPLEAQPLLAIANDASPYLRASIALVLSRFSGDDARASIVAATDDEQWLVREAAFRSLGSRKRLTREMMSKALADDEPRVRQAAIRAVTGSTTNEMPTASQAAHLAQTAAAAGTNAAGASVYATLDADARMDTLTTVEKMMLLRNVPMFEDLDPDDLQEITEIVDERRFYPGQLLCREGDQGDDVFLIVRGAVRVYTGGEGTPERTLAELGPGAYLGEMSVFDPAPRSATVAATEKTRTLVVRGAEFKNLMLVRPEISQRIIAELVGRMRALIAANS